MLGWMWSSVVSQDMCLPPFWKGSKVLSPDQTGWLLPGRHHFLLGLSIIVILRWLSLIISDDKHFFIYLLTFVYFWRKCLFNYILGGVVCSCYLLLLILDISPLSDVWCVNISSFQYCLLVLAIVFLEAISFLYNPICIFQFLFCFANEVVSLKISLMSIWRVLLVVLDTFYFWISV